ncbi:MAG: NAD(+) diphosphatase [Pseudomonadota bacterium]
MYPTLGATGLLDRQNDLRADRDHIDAALAAETSRFFVLAGNRPIVDSDADRQNTSLRWFSRQELDTMGVSLMETLYLGDDPSSGAAQFAVLITEHFARHAPEAGGRLAPAVDLRSIASQGSMEERELALAAQAVGLRNWHDESRCCGRCGGSMSIKNGGWKRRCWACKNEAFPRVDPVVIMAVTFEDKLLLAHEERFPDTMYSTIAGFVEPGDDVFHAVRRETKEEVGIDVGEVLFIGSQPWPFAHSLMIGCIGRASSSEITINTNEITHARWFDRDEVTSMVKHQHAEGLWVPGPHSMAHALILHYLEETA